MKRKVFEENICSFCSRKEQCDKKIIVCIEELNSEIITYRCDKYIKNEEVFCAYETD